VTPWLSIGPALEVDAYGVLRERGVTHVVDLRAESQDDAAAVGALGLRWAGFAVVDRHPPEDGVFAELAGWVAGERARDPDARFYVHCEAGMGRAPTVAAALLLEQGLGLESAHRHLLMAYGRAQPTERQMAWLEGLEARSAG